MAASTVTEEPVLEVRGLVKHYHVTRREGWRARPETVRAVDGIDLHIGRGETLGLVGESGWPVKRPRAGPFCGSLSRLRARSGCAAWM